MKDFIKKILITTCVWGITFANAQSRTSKHRTPLPIFYKEAGITLTKLNFKDTLEYKINNYVYRIKLLNFQGSAFFETSIKGRVVECGYYKSQDTLMRETRTIPVINSSKKKKITYSFYSPLRSGEWVIYDSVKKIHNIIHYTLQ